MSTRVHKTNAAIAAATALFGLSLSAQAATIDSATMGLSDADVTITFDEVALARGTQVTDQFESFGVTFSPAVTYFPSISPRPNFDGAAVLDFNFAAGTAGTPVTLNFTDTVSAVSLLTSGNFGQVTFSAFLGGSLVESFTSSVDLTANNFYGFEGIRLDALTLTPSGSNSFALDELAFDIAPVPVPASLPLLVGGMLGLGWMARRRKNAA